MTEMEIVKFFAGLFILIGAFLSLVTAFGLIRLPDVYTRNHAASKSATMGVMLVLLGTFLYFWLIEDHFNSRLLLGIGFIFLTSPVAGHLISRAAYNSGVKLSDRTVQDDLAKARKEIAENQSK
ncbi:monovalent cation/H(+) antiporter subunit G [Mesobacillus sp. AQ2]|jgi:multicomponent Na+:H+ antiporter subunit G|uniref:monovalent cation/H(+) antiporter subunit G n=1 Tax=Bacillaceae TaxID=186817 RepID=UPI0011A34B8B|nr:MULTISPECIES: monovalent cation/H(+) antiporter subunit G [Bacillaceae]MBT2704075.1 Na+/H+ antiporter subunit G [Chryseobacterium sp. ISL-80]MBT2679078.1 Na+/H+ antiporter subunit G [Bacillus sp. ISL-35]MCM3125953.1 monovalent cation/H(+) antiporter subunit G [Mesobacillus sp. MER 33]MCM3235060.1 monovalent cation/H(+) antiporter subunit G [Mesobacillus sp. MER 48]WHX40007.1 monovalent cation/H(+) antiporter subunit G [Mesobacillus sp. AQ2]